jgi:hypothetical protein
MCTNGTKEILNEPIFEAISSTASFDCQREMPRKVKAR